VNGRQRLVAVSALCLLAVVPVGCRTNYYIVPLPIIKAYEAPLPVNCGFFMTRDLRDQWWDSTSGIPRIDVPIGKVVLDFAKANLQDAFRRPEAPENPEGVGVTIPDFYTIRYADRRSNYGILLKLNAIDFRLEGTTAVCTLDVTLEDAANREIFTRSYSAKGTPEQGVGLLQKTLKGGQGSIELSTAAALDQIFQNILADIRALMAQGG
jgi:hypothetical protein